MTRLYCVAALVLSACTVDTKAIGIDEASGRPIGNGAECGAASACGGETPMCRMDGFCVACTDNGQCGGEDPICTSRGLCEECGSNADCSGDNPFCNRALGECVECSTSTDCGPDGVCAPDGECEQACSGPGDCDQDEVCGADIGTCTECAANSDCAGDESLCDPVEYECVECLVASDCGAGEPFCIDGECQECRVNADCANGQICNTDLECQSPCETNAQCDDGDRKVCDITRGLCLECIDNTHCVEDEDKPICLASECVECRTSADCPTDKPNCSEENQCED